MIIRKHHLLMAGVLVSALALPVASHAELDEIVVRAERAAANIQDVPLAVTALPASALETRQISGIGDLQASVPGLSISNNTGTASGARIFLRGVGEDESRITADPAVGIYVDGVYLGRQTGALLDLLDVESIEVLRGPQGTLYGRNTSGGAIKLNTRRPNTDGHFSSFSLTIGEQRERNFKFNTNIAASDSTAISIAALAKDREGFFSQPATSYNSPTIGKNDLLAGRVSILHEFSEDWNLYIALDHTDDKSDPRPQVPVANADPFQLAADDSTEYASQVIQDGLNVTFTGTIDDRHTFSWTSSGRLLEDSLVTRIGFPYTQNTDQTQFTQELLISSDYSGIFNWIAGVYVYDEEATLDNTFFSTDNINVDTFAYAGYAQFKIIPTERLRVTAGIRYTIEEKDLNATAVLGENTRTKQQSLDFDKIIYRAAVDVDVTESAMFYASYATGYKSGGWSPDCLNDTACYRNVAEEDVETIEAGWRITLDDARLNFTGFYNLYDNLQLNGSLPVGFTRFNVPKAKVYGLEFEFDGNFTDHLSFFGNAAWLEAEYDDLTASVASAIAGSGSPCNSHTSAPEDETDAAKATREGTLISCVSGLELKNAPKYKATFGLTYARQLESFNLELTGQLNYEDESFTLSANAPDIFRKEAILVDVRAKFSDPKNLWNIVLWGKNITDEIYAPAGVTGGGGNLYYADPATAGITLNVNF